MSTMDICFDFTILYNSTVQERQEFVRHLIEKQQLLSSKWNEANKKRLSGSHSIEAIFIDTELLILQVLHCLLQLNEKSLDSQVLLGLEATKNRINHDRKQLPIFLDPFIMKFAPQIHPILLRFCCMLLSSDVKTFEVHIRYFCTTSRKPNQEWKTEKSFFALVSYMIGSFNMEQNNFKAAANSFSLATMLNPYCFLFWYHRINIHKELCETTKALKAISECLSIDSMVFYPEFYSMRVSIMLQSQKRAGNYWSSILRDLRQAILCGLDSQNQLLERSRIYMTLLHEPKLAFYDALNAFHNESCRRLQQKRPARSYFQAERFLAKLYLNYFEENYLVKKSTTMEVHNETVSSKYLDYSQDFDTFQSTVARRFSV